MSDTEQKTPNKTGASGAAWSDSEKIAYLIVLCENEGKIDSKIANAPIPVGRSIVSCKKLLHRLKEKHKDDIAKIKAGQALNANPIAGGGDADGTPSKKSAKGRKRKAKVDEDTGTDESPTKKTTGGRKKNDAVMPIKQEVNDEQEDEDLDNSLEV